VTPNRLNLIRQLQHRITRGGWYLVPPLLLAIAPLALAAETTNVTEPTAAKQETNASPEALRAYLELQEQLHAARLAIEHNRQEAEIAAAHNAELVAARLKALEDAMVEQRDALVKQRSQDREVIESNRDVIDTLQNANRLMIKIGSACAAVGFIALLLTAYFQWRAVSRLTEFSVLSQGPLTLGRGALPASGSADLPTVGALPEQINTRLLGALERLEQRIIELENIARAPLGEQTSASGPLPADGANGGNTNRFAVLLAKGESLMNLDKTEEALACFDEILGFEPDHSDALVKKGDALERLHRIDEAIGCYDHAIAAGGSLTVAYLHKGGLFNRLERYEEALHCYEQALRTQEKSQTV